MLGLSLLFNQWFGISPGISCLIMDCAAMAAGAAILKNGFLRDSLVASVSYALWYMLQEKFSPVMPDLSAYPLAAAVLGAAFVGIGCGLVVRHNCAAGGDDALALLFHKKTGIKVSLFYLLSDTVVLLLSLSYIPVTRIIWSLLSVMMSSAIIELLRPNNKRKTVPAARS